MHNLAIPSAFAAILLAGLAAAPIAQAQAPGSRVALNPVQEKIAAIMKMPHRNAANRARDRNRDPVKAMQFCRLRDDMKVIDWAPGRGWYTEILGPLLKDKGSLYVSTSARSLARLDKLLTLEPMSKVKKLPVNISRHPVERGVVIETLDFGMRDADMLLNIREYHNLHISSVLKFNKAALQSLKPGGYYCIIDHTRRHMEANTNENRRRVDPVLLIKQVLEAGFTFVNFTDLFLRPDDELRYEVGRRTVTGNTDRFTILFQKPLPRN